MIFKYVLAFGCASLLYSSAVAQTGTVSPYSRYGLGDLRYAGSVKQVAMGRSGVALSDRDRINALNPAALNRIEVAILEAAVRADVTRHTSENESQTTNGSSINYFSLGFPIMKGRWGAALGVRPYSSVGYEVANTAESTVCDCGRIESSYSGEGDINSYFLGTGIAPFAGRKERFYASALYDSLKRTDDTLAIRKHERRIGALEGLSVGLQGSWLFGSLSHVRSVDFIDSTGLYDTRIENKLTLRDIYLAFGVMYEREWDGGRFFSAGLSGSPNSMVNARRNRLWYTYRSNDFFIDVRDTVEYLNNQDGEVTIPLSWSAGLAFGKKNKWALTADFAAQSWSDFKSYGEADSLVDAMSVSAGFEMIPSYGGSRLLQNVWYRFGAYYNSSYLQLNGQHIDDYGITIGLGIPMLKSDHSRNLSPLYQQKAVLQFAVEAGQRGRSDEGLVKHQYLMFHLGVVFKELWFTKRKYD